MSLIKVEAPAKLNLHLQIGDRRPDGFHEIQSLFLALAFGDTLFCETVSTGIGAAPSAVEIAVNWRALEWQTGASPPPPEENIVSRAVSLFRSRTGYTDGLKITVEKRIPLGGGLGGGSSDAAAALVALNRLAAAGGAAPVSDADLAEMGASLGSDVPFFLRTAAAAWVSGRGEKVTPAPLPESFNELSLILVNPGFPSDTAAAYHLLDTYRHIIPSFDKKDNFLWQALSDSPRNWPFFNDFLPVFRDGAGEFETASEIGTVYQRIIFCLRDLGADFAGLSGSGSTCFGVFSEKDSAESARKALLKYWPFVINTKNLKY